MAGMQFEYDEKGGTFYYFLLSFMAVVLVPATYIFWPRVDEKEELKLRKECQCDPCHVKRKRLRDSQPWKRIKSRSIKLGLIVVWLLFCLVAYKVSQVELDFKEFDPYAELGIDRGASSSEIKKAYRRLSLQYHPDKDTGDSTKFMLITKAHQALTDEEARKNWEEHGNPDGPGATHLGIALPKWIVEKQNSVWVVLAVYGLVFMVVLPTVVGTWWYRSIQYSAEQILMDTTQLYFYFFHKTPNMILKRVIMILGASMEFERGHSSEVVERPSDNEEIPMLIRDLPHLNEKNKEKPLCYPYSIKARALLHAHFSRQDLPAKTLELDKQYVLKKSPFLIQEMVSIVAQLVAMAHAGRVSRMPRLETIEAIMKLSQMVVQGLWDIKSPMLQLPHVSDEMLRYFNSRKRSVRTIRDLAKLKDEDRRLMLRNFSEAEYHDLMLILAEMPLIDMEARCAVLDDDDPTITAGSIVTVTVNLTRNSMKDIMEGGEQLLAAMQKEEDDVAGAEDVEPEEETKTEEAAANPSESPARKPKVWEKQPRKKKGGKGGKPGKKVNKAKTVTPVVVKKPEVKEDEEKREGTPNGSVPKASRPSKATAESSEEDSEVDSEEEESTNASEQASKEPEGEEDDWERFQEESKKDGALEAKSKESHLVHCPYFPVPKHEWWWLYVADRKNHLLITAPVQVCSLKHEEQVQLKFSAPPKPGVYQYSVILRSDSYFDFDQSQFIKLDVKEAKKVESHPQWDMSEEEDGEEKDDADLSDSDDYDSDVDSEDD
ncbi:hypothetical protein CAPTEDRAFT_160293 [Capitella teleta]|uniref:J domain-containing protein n=1 Tax=Capitella teleta TaxID=283909 RepID=R7VFG1_CAPTE|nr:hypothetical protein CAPTEDRAFT_160293 [Capitella teleta]|eukprot:ELU17583.1 hypothetical protein CAPTEDRAFT_160293 [Capitella teleta]